MSPAPHSLATILATAVVAQPCFLRELADEALRDAAILEHGSDEVEVDDETCTSPSEDGTWVQAWVWVPKSNESDEADDSDDEPDVRNAPRPARSTPMSDDSLTTAVKAKLAALNSPDPARMVEACADLCAEAQDDPPIFSTPFTKEYTTHWGPTRPPPPRVLFAAGYLLGIADLLNISVEEVIDNLDVHLPSDSVLDVDNDEHDVDEETLGG